VTTTGTLGVGYDKPQLGPRTPAKSPGHLLMDDAGTSIDRLFCDDLSGRAGHGTAGVSSQVVVFGDDADPSL
jgi:hypothetical protein